MHNTLLEKALRVSSQRFFHFLANSRELRELREMREMREMN
jgi:hypothetical protein